ncbi:MAG TPA: hypothetical protein PKN48_10245 [Bacteroidales bacterium]|nr:hypothetical protein [Bacteroidales bacterium]
MKIVYNKEVTVFFNDLIDILFEQEYFSYYDSSKKYVLKLKSEIQKTIHIKQRHNTPQSLIKHGKHYKKFSISKRTTWVVFYTLKNGTYYINYITNNHTPDAEHILGIR